MEQKQRTEKDKQYLLPLFEQRSHSEVTNVRVTQIPTYQTFDLKKLKFLLLRIFETTACGLTAALRSRRKLGGAQELAREAARAETLFLLPPPPPEILCKLELLFL